MAFTRTEEGFWVSEFGRLFRAGHLNCSAGAFELASSAGIGNTLQMRRLCIRESRQCSQRGDRILVGRRENKVLWQIHATPSGKQTVCRWNAIQQTLWHFLVRYKQACQKTLWYCLIRARFKSENICLACEAERGQRRRHRYRINVSLVYLYRFSSRQLRKVVTSSRHMREHGLMLSVLCNQWKL